jgi:hypothetical protein
MFESTGPLRLVAQLGGGALLINSGSVSIHNSLVSGCKAMEVRCGQLNQTKHLLKPAILCCGQTANIRLGRKAFKVLLLADAPHGCAQGGSGGAVYIQGGDLTITDTSIVSCDADVQLEYGEARPRPDPRPPPF